MRFIAAQPSDMLQTIGRAMTVVETVGSVPRGLTMAETAEQCGFNPASTGHYLRSLAWLRYLIFWDDHRFTLGPAFADRAGDLAAQMRARHDEGATLQQLAAHLERPPSFVGRLLSGATESTAARCRCGKPLAKTTTA